MAAVVAAIQTAQLNESRNSRSSDDPFRVNVDRIAMTWPVFRLDQPTLIARTSAARASTGIIGSSPSRVTGKLRR